MVSWKTMVDFSPARRDEAKAQTALGRYLREKRIMCYYELKVCDTNSRALGRIEKHQIDGLVAMEKEGFVWKLSDQDIRVKPCDGFCTPPLPAFVVVKYRDNKFFFIPVKEVIKLREEGLLGIRKDTAEKLAVHIASY